jgi:hypothetical protein
LKTSQNIIRENDIFSSYFIEYNCIIVNHRCEKNFIARDFASRSGGAQRVVGKLARRRNGARHGGGRFGVRQGGGVAARWRAATRRIAWREERAEVESG